MKQVPIAYLDTYYSDGWLGENGFDLNPYLRQLDVFYETGVWGRRSSVNRSNVIDPTILHLFCSSFVFILDKVRLPDHRRWCFCMNSESMTTEQIWELLSDKLRNFLLKRVSDEQIAEDLLQEIFIRVHKGLASSHPKDFK